MCQKYLYCINLCPLQIITNEGNGYSQHTGVFKCPEAGVYMFSFFIGQRDVSVPRGIAADLMVNSKNVLGTTVEALNPGQDITVIIIPI